jgi:hypothetical protein
MKQAMGDPTKDEAASPHSSNLDAVKVAGIIALFVVSIGIMAGFYYYPWPGGRPSAGEFIAFFARELLIMGVVVFGVLAAGASRVWRAIKRDATNSGHAP